MIENIIYMAYIVQISKVNETQKSNKVVASFVVKVSKTVTATFLDFLVQDKVHTYFIRNKHASSIGMIW